jgi:hypothetical protein
MAYKIFTEAKPFLKADIRPLNVTEMRMLTFSPPALTIPWESVKLSHHLIRR